jgi:hypothetical protein
MKINPKIGETWLRITPPSDGQPGYSQAGTVDVVTDESVEVLVQCDVIRRMTFSRQTGLDTSGLGTFLVRHDVVGP